jgi:uncharacterized membrane protein
MRLMMSAFYLIAGILHVVHSDAFLPIVPGWVPHAQAVVIVTGLCEIAGAISLLTPGLRRLAGIMLALYALCVWPANFKHALDHIVLPPIPDTWWYHAPRLAFQPVLIWWALYCSNVVNWPWGGRAATRA